MRLRRNWQGEAELPDMPGVSPSARLRSGEKSVVIWMKKHRSM